MEGCIVVKYSELNSVPIGDLWWWIVERPSCFVDLDFEVWDWGVCIASRVRHEGNSDGGGMSSWCCSFVVCVGRCV